MCERLHGLPRSFPLWYMVQKEIGSDSLAPQLKTTWKSLLSTVRAHEEKRLSELKVHKKRCGKQPSKSASGTSPFSVDPMAAAQDRLLTFVKHRCVFDTLLHDLLTLFLDKNLTTVLLHERLQWETDRFVDAVFMLSANVQQAGARGHHAPPASRRSGATLPQDINTLDATHDNIHSPSRRVAPSSSPGHPSTLSPAARASLPSNAQSSSPMARGTPPQDDELLARVTPPQDDELAKRLREAKEAKEAEMRREVAKMKQQLERMELEERRKQKKREADEERRRRIQDNYVKKCEAEEKLKLLKVQRRLEGLQRVAKLQSKLDAREKDIQERELQKQERELLKEVEKMEGNIREYAFMQSKIYAEKVEYDDVSNTWTDSSGWTDLAELKAHQFSLTPEGEGWKFREIESAKLSVRVRKRPFECGSFRFCYYAQLSDGRKMVAKAFIADKFIKDKTVMLQDAIAQMRIHMIAHEYAKIFSATAPAGTTRVEYVKSWLLSDVKAGSSPFNGHYIWFLEPLLDGSFVKYNNNKDQVKDEHEVPQAFSHFCWHQSKQRFMVVDVQGLHEESKRRYMLTDPAIHSKDNSCGDTDLGSSGFSHFFGAHRCNTLCRQLRLAAHPAQSSA